MPESLLVLVPVKSLALAKSRIDLADSERCKVAHVLASHTLRTVVEACGRGSLRVVTTDREIKQLTHDLGGTSIDDPHGDLNLALAHALSQLSLSRPVLIMVSDLPLLTVEDVRYLVTEVIDSDEPRHVADLHGTGTTAVFLPAGWRLPLLFGTGSAARFRAGWRSVNDAPSGVRTDLDTLEDLRIYGLPHH